ncbi:hypothetical protein MB02_03570 [Croceicoccus estronivorus]|uniref:TraB/GumN family protein n=1 Tax=Croceicoccus estronivorus TaxID=1172626 RepID=UPI00082BE30D|nr:TraB/GumN family protein [Croceicoccus estronivorus]OCC24580.1 hypothetical protein MB02_03570 [Croceicoccus estronivorus]
MKARIALVFVAALLVWACGESRPAVTATPALWEVTGTEGQHAYLFGTIHSLPENVDWQSPEIKRALQASDRLVLEIAQLDDPGTMQQVFSRLAAAPAQPPLSARLSPQYRPALARVLKQSGLVEESFAKMDTWAAALTLAQAAQGTDDGESVDRALMEMADGKPVMELEGTYRQLGLFDALPEQEQRDLLDAVVAEADTAEREDDTLDILWRRGDMTALARETRRGMLADPELRQALLVQRNARWITQIVAMLEQRQHPFVAVGAAHMAGPDGLPALLRQQGYKVTRVQ